MRNSCVALIASLFVLFACGQPITLQSVTRVMNFTNSYSMEYFTHNGGGIVNIRFTLRYKGFDISNWSNQGQNGIWLGIGWGQEIMNGSEVAQCQLSYSNNTNNDKFVCNDRYA